MMKKRRIQQLLPMLAHKIPKKTVQKEPQPQSLAPARGGGPESSADVVVLGMTFKENCPDLRNSKVIDVVRELRSFGADVRVHDPIADSAECEHEYGVALTPWDQLPQAAAIVAARHRLTTPWPVWPDPSAAGRPSTVTKCSRPRSWPGSRLAPLLHGVRSAEVFAGVPAGANAGSEPRGLG